MEQERKIDVMIAEACHEEYVDIILDTIEAAAKASVRRFHGCAPISTPKKLFR